MGLSYPLITHKAALLWIPAYLLAILGECVWFSLPFYILGRVANAHFDGVPAHRDAVPICFVFSAVAAAGFEIWYASMPKVGVDLGVAFFPAYVLPAMLGGYLSGAVIYLLFKGLIPTQS